MFNVNNEIARSAYIGFCFMILATVFYTISNLEKLFLASTQKENPSFSGDGYCSLAIVFVSYSAFMWLVPPIISVCGTKVTLIVGSLGYRMLYGNIFALITFQRKNYLDKHSRTTVILALLGISIAGTLILLCLPSPKNSDGIEIREDHGDPITALKKTWEIATTKYMLILFIPFVFMGLQVCFMSGVYGSCVGFTKQLEHSEQLVPLIGLSIGVGEIVSAFSLICLGQQVALRKWGRTSVMLVALLIEYITFLLVFLNLPNNSVFGETRDLAILPSSWWNAVLASFFIGLSDGIYMSMIPSMVGIIFPHDSMYGCAVYTFIYSIFSSLGFFSSNYIGLYWQLLVLTVTATLGALCYIHVSWDMQRHTDRQRGIGQQQEISKL